MENIQLDPHNYRIHNDRNKSIIRKSLEECGAGRSVLMDKENYLIAGNDLITAQDKRKFIELKAVVNELENCLDIAESMMKLEKEEK